MGVRDELVQAGVELLEKQGLAALTQRRIANQVGVSHGAPRHYFPTYASLLAAIARVGVDDLDAIIATNLAIDDVRTALTSTCIGVVEFAVQRPAMFELIGRHDLLDGAGENLRATTGRWLERVTARIGEARPGADQRHGLALWAGVQGLGTVLGRGSGDAITDTGVDPRQVARVLVDGIIGVG
ncbi:TetR/AcrR family transcriptional regulator [Rhodococcoides kroppenstedtii]|uniref:TetR/AcrR family transcriptional regulator n=1 Tax=Rhodococcoides kroppenstedtii TaxID=293050 RepID=UPI0036361EB2